MSSLSSSLTVTHQKHSINLSNTTLGWFSDISAYHKKKNLKKSDPELRRAWMRPLLWGPITSYSWESSGSGRFSPCLHFSLHTSNVIYMIHCTHCGDRYVGETGHALLTHLKQHLYNIQIQNISATFQSPDSHSRNKSLVVTAAEEKERDTEFTGNISPRWV